MKYCQCVDFIVLYVCDMMKVINPKENTIFLV